MAPTSLGNYKMAVMLPVMLLARKLDSEDVNQVQAIRIAYGCIQSICVLVVLYVYYTASSMNEKKIIYVPPAPQPLADPNAPKKYTQIPFNAHCLTTSRNLVFSTMFGVLLTCGLHIYKGMLMGLAMQVIMGPLNLWEAGIVQAVLRNKLHPDHSFFDEKLSRDQLEPDAEVVDEKGEPITAAVSEAAITSNKASAAKPLPEFILDTWDAGKRADVPALLARLTKDTVNTRCPPEQWTTAMILAGLKEPSALVGLRRCVVDYGADTSLVDEDGWTCLHWAAFHGNEPAARFLKEFGMALDMEDKEGKTPSAVAKAERNSSIAELLVVSSKKGQ